MTFFAKLKADGTLERYPYTLTDLRRDNPSTSFARDIDLATAALFGAVPVEPTPEPAEDHTVDFSRTAELVSGKWVEVWTSKPAASDVIALRTANKSGSVRSERNALLSACDWTQLADAPGPTKAAWVHYRQALRDVPSQAGFPWSVAWPSAPGT